MTSLYWPYWLAHYYSFLEIDHRGRGADPDLSLDDLFDDLWYWSRRLFLQVHRGPKIPAADRRAVARDEQPLAIMVPAWLEYDVIAPMIENMVSTLDYQNYVVFVGTYINDQRTIDEVERMRRRYKQLHRVEVPHAGPTCKADCLNWVIQAIFLHEKTHGADFRWRGSARQRRRAAPNGIAPVQLLAAAQDMIQLPVVSLERNWYE